MVEHPLVVTLDKPIAIPGPNSYPADTTHFRAREHSEPHTENGTYTFYSCNIGPENTVVDVAASNIRAIAYVGDVIRNDDTTES